MRLWSIHPKYLDSKGLVALWRESLLAKAVLEEKTTGYRNHPQLTRFRKTENPQKMINLYIKYIFLESQDRGYHFDPTKFKSQKPDAKIPVNSGQITFEFDHLTQKIKTRNPKLYSNMLKIKQIDSHPLFKIVPGPIEEWEIL
ncbi:hypothetical protein JW710_00625 [Candidatus Dojkabacteria bacterium]|nr:hypothetical protein [Candidatus Dojkabacteria bacterium]